MLYQSFTFWCETCSVLNLRSFLPRESLNFSPEVPLQQGSGQNLFSPANSYNFLSRFIRKFEKSLTLYAAREYWQSTDETLSDAERYLLISVTSKLFSTSSLAAEIQQYLSRFISIILLYSYKLLFCKLLISFFKAFISRLASTNSLKTFFNYYSEVLALRESCSRRSWSFPARSYFNLRYSAIRCNSCLARYNSSMFFIQLTMLIHCIRRFAERIYFGLKPCSADLTVGLKTPRYLMEEVTNLFPMTTLLKVACLYASSNKVYQHPHTQKNPKKHQQKNIPNFTIP